MRSALIWIGLALVAMFVIGAVFFSHDMRNRYDAFLCDRTDSTTLEKIECWFSIVDGEMRQRGIGAAIRTYKYLFSTYPAFAARGCDPGMHRIGDMAYYELYLRNENISSLDIPANANTCNYGFFHGFLEHVFQNYPDPGFIRSTCTKLTERFSTEMPGVRSSCYHAAGHGLMISHNREYSPQGLGNAGCFSRPPNGSM